MFLKETGTWLCCGDTVMISSTGTSSCYKDRNRHDVLKCHTRKLYADVRV
uniref:Uncharacterized protein n=1 Tax=Rhizophora mucronata TaxID=61149 RepID=A0A2P2Q650_RHIMU